MYVAKQGTIYVCSGCGRQVVGEPPARCPRPGCHLANNRKKKRPHPGRPKNARKRNA